MKKRLRSIAVALLASGSGCDAGRAAPEAEVTPVLFVHGSGLDSRYWSEMIGAFRDAGYPASALEAVDLVPNDGDNVRAAEGAIAEAVEHLLARGGGSGPRKVDIVAHSMGAFSARWYAAKIGPERVRRLVAIAGANHGTDALCGLSGRGNRQMCPAFAMQSESPQAALNGTPRAPLDETPFGLGEDSPDVARIPPDAQRAIAYVTLRLERDPWIVPSESAILGGAGGVEIEALGPFAETSTGNYVVTAPIGHDELVLDRRVIGFVLSVLLAEPTG